MSYSPVTAAILPEAGELMLVSGERESKAKPLPCPTSF
jgi:hypothetical protein